MQLMIPTPCHEDWAAMTPQEQGRFCNNCQKTVTDFTGMTDAEVLVALAQSGGGCGRFRAGQLGREMSIPAPLLPATGPHKTWLPVWTLAACFVLCAPMALSAAPRAPLVQVVTLHRVPLPADTGITLQSRVVDEKGHALPGAIVSVASHRLHAVTNREGYFTLRPEAALPKHFSLTVSAVGYETRTLRVKDGRIPASIVIKMSMLVLGEVAFIPAD
ncbi:hypothetical protein DCC81_01035 [Chitinophaga parva]|uniref:Carboxypeptidase-like regulatory domain-containing protein n=1 Tax=Chitinophaga parva TaxID=2169414 RepID=A0A2T7BK98_9BACT|nr:carboxypeptidase-like regulatory domain-containing protein [Chitinophaga parva]PUZ28098.1 hypothetical protein DCC81_01035 [Chitinophaga parva]